MPLAGVHERRARPDEHERADEAAAAESGSASPETPAASPDVAAGPDVTMAPEASTGSAGELPAAASDEPHRDHASAMLAAGLGLLGIGGAAGLAGASSASSAPSMAASKPIGVIDSPNTDHPKSDPPVSEQKPDEGSTKPGPDQPSTDHPPPDQQPHTGQPQQPDPGTTNSGPSHPDPAQPGGTDQQPPAQPGGTDQHPPVHVPVAPALALASDTGLSSHDLITASGSVNVSGLEPDATLAVSLDGGKTWIPRGADAQLPDALFGADGVKHLEVRQIDASGHPGDVADLSFTLDRTAPETLHWSMPADKAALGKADLIAVQGIEPDALVEYRPDAQSPWLGAAGGLIPVSMFQHDGTGHVEVRQTDVAGNESPVATLEVPVDLTAPAVPTLTLLNDTGVRSDDGVTSSGQIHVGGLEDGATLRVSTNGGDWQALAAGTTVVDQDWLFPFGGRPTVQVQQVDRAGNASDAASLSFTLDNQALSPSWMSSGQDHSGVDRRPEQVTLNAHDYFQVNRYSGSDGRQDVLSYRVDGGSWSAVPADGLLPLSGFGADGQHQLDLRETDLAGNIAIRPVQVSLDTTAPNAPRLSLEQDDGVSSTDRITSNPNVAVGGLQAGDAFKYRVNGGEWLPGQNVEGGFVEDVDLRGHYGSNTVEVYLIDAAGNAGPSSQLTFQYVQHPGAVI